MSSKERKNNKEAEEGEIHNLEQDVSDAVSLDLNKQIAEPHNDEGEIHSTVQMNEEKGEEDERDLA